MATRTIVTSQPDVSCSVCERRLLRGEQPEVFLAAGRPRTVCELCAPRAAHQGWQREAATPSLSAPPLRSGRGRSFFGRLRQVGRPAPETPAGVSADSAFEPEPEPYDFLGAAPAAAPGTLAVSVEEAFGVAQQQLGAVRRDGPLQLAMEVFNAGEYPRRVASLTRSLGAPEVSVRAGEAVASAIVITLAWELCWYQYEVDTSDGQGAGTQAIAQGTELAELRHEDRLANALADERGALALLDRND
jgi:hypothetical protein